MYIKQSLSEINFPEFGLAWATNLFPLQWKL